MHIKIRPHNEASRKQYKQHGHYHAGDAGLDLFIMEDQIIRAGETAPLKLQISCETASGQPYYLMPRSSISKTPLRMSNSIGLIDGGYRGEIIGMVDNIKTEDYQVSAGDRLFQLVAMDGSPITFELVENLSDTARGTGGFGSTGN
ncbi:MAG: dUTP diphosphatase [FCB group bacterium]|nr:dUTP diphosphatase [FCB group bacterium]MBL7027526.1 dUTP diphosphatase [Candidatus Neomarinimicrobiota bacterium]MBL7121156.1 dUTP diphosphatase [Candidatus Neomarinimicrobiota bacterium]